MLLLPFLRLDEHQLSLLIVKYFFEMTFCNLLRKNMETGMGIWLVTVVIKKSFSEKVIVPIQLNNIKCGERLKAIYWILYRQFRPIRVKH
jgi:hypothetical protein